MVSTFSLTINTEKILNTRSIQQTAIRLLDQNSSQNISFDRLFPQRIFHLRVVVHLRRFAAWVCASSVVSLLSQPVLSVLLTIHNGVGHRQLSVGVSGHELFALFIAGTLWLIASVMTHASALADENAQFI